MTNQQKADAARVQRFNDAQAKLAAAREAKKQQSPPTQGVPMTTAAKNTNSQHPKAPATTKTQGQPAGKGKQPQAPTEDPKAAEAPKAIKPTRPAKREVVYPDYRQTVYMTGHKNGPITAKWCEERLGWMTEKQWAAFHMAMPKYAKTKEEQWAFGNDFLLVDEDGNKVRCEHNGGNRELVLSHCRKLAQSILNRQWWGPSIAELKATAPNGEEIIISKTGIVFSGQHRMVALILAKQKWDKAEEGSELRKRWPTEPVIDSAVTFGVDEDPRMTITLDNTLTRTPADALYTSAFAGLAKDERSLCSQMMAVALDFLRTRTGADDRQRNSEHCHRTNMEMMDFFDRHKPHLLESLKTVLGVNKDNPLQDVGLSPGRCSGTLYLMGSSKTDFEDYHGMEVPNEKALDWSRWEQARDLFEQLCLGDKGTMKSLKHALEMLADQGGSRVHEKNSLLSLAWGLHADGKDVEPGDLVLEYRVKDAEGKLLPESKPLEEFAEDETPDGLAPDFVSDFGGIDLGDKKPTTITSADVATAAEEERKARQEEARKEIARKLEEARKKAPAGVGRQVETRLPDGSTVGRPMSRKEIEAENRRKAAEADAEMSAEGEGEEAEPEEGEDDGAQYEGATEDESDE